ncbi:MAG: vitamin K epoxide reductase family protein [Beutenbergiaceae bacterium]
MSAKAEAAETAGDRWRGSEVERAGGAGLEFAWLLIIAGMLGTIASLMLNIEYIHTLRDPDYVPACDLNPLLSCGNFLGSPQAQAFGFPNVIIGIAAFPVLVTTGVVFLAGARLPRWYWRGLLVGTLFGIAFVLWLQYQAMFILQAICPWCALVWAVMIPIFVHTATRATQNGALPASGGLRALLVQYRWVWTGLWYLVLIAVALIVLADGWLSLL